MKNKLKNYFSRCVMPGYNYEGEKTTFIVMMIFSGLLALVFDFEYSAARNSLYVDYWNSSTLRPGAVMRDFDDILGGTLSGFIISAVVMLIYIWVRYNYLHKETKSIYLMRRLPAKGELLRRCTVIPVMESLIFLACWFIMLVFFFAIYMISTPDECLTPGQWSKIWR